MRLIYDTVTKVIYEVQSHATPGTLLQNCANYGIDLTNLVELEVDKPTYDAMKLEDPNWIAKLAKLQAEQDRIEKRRTDIALALPSWAEYRDEYTALIDAAQAADTLNKVKSVVVNIARRLKKDAKILYWLAKDTDD